MKTKNFTTTILVDQTQQEAFDAINDVRAWWSGEIEGRTDVLGDSQINFVRDKSEWDGTDIVFEIAKKGYKTEIRFAHVGLVPTIECYDGCSGAWGFYLNERLRNFIAKGTGQPNPDERRPSRAKSRGEQRAPDSRR
jgi:hypothetical protein